MWCGPSTVHARRHGDFAQGRNLRVGRSVEARDPHTVVFHLKHPDNFLLTNLSTGAHRIDPRRQRTRFLAASRWHGAVPLRQPADRSGRRHRAQSAQLANCSRRSSGCASAVVPDAITESLELEKGSGDVAVNSLPMDALPVLATRQDLVIEDAPPGRRSSISRSIRVIPS